MKEKYGYSRYFRSFQILADFLFINFFYFFVLEHIGYSNGLTVRTVVDFNLLWALSILVINPYQVYRYSGPLKLIRKQLYVLLIFLIFLSLFLSYFFGYSEFGALRYSKILLAFATLFLFWKILLYSALYLFRISGRNRRNFIVIGNGPLVEDFVNEIKGDKSLGYYHLETIVVNKSNTQSQLIELLYASDNLDSTHIVYIALPSIKESYLNELISFFETKQILVRIILDFKSSMARKGELEFVDYIPVLNFISDPLDSLSLSFQKRFFDLIFSFFTIILLAPVFIIVAVTTYFSSKGPVFYKQERIGRKGRAFTIYKFRSMYTDAENLGPALSTSGDHRVTGWGKIMRKYRLDEIPQFFNVLFGSMSIVGPRPEREFWKLQIEEHSPKFNRLTYVKPGITSLGQVKFGYAENIGEMRKRLRYDLLYLNNMSIWMDLKIIFMTMIVVLKGEGK